jgi:hypothetical protein
MQVDLVNLLNDLFILKKLTSEICLNECILCGSLILHSLSRINFFTNLDVLAEKIHAFSKTNTALDYVLNYMNLSSTFILNLINMLQTSVENNSIEDQSNKAIVLNDVGSFSKLCELSIPVDLLGYMFRKNRYKSIKHDFNKYFEIALNQDNERMAICILEYMLESTKKLITLDLWEEFQAKRWWNLFEFILEKCCLKEKSQIVKYDLVLLEYVDDVKDELEIGFNEREKNSDDSVDNRRQTELPLIERRDLEEKHVQSDLEEKLYTRLADRLS